MVYPSDIINGVFTVPEGVTSIGDDVFFGCTGVAHISIDTSDKESFEKFERIKAQWLQEIRDKVITPTHFHNQVSLESGSERDSAINLLIKGHKPDDEANNELYNHWLDFREQVLKTPHQHTRQRSTLKNLCLFAVKKGLQNGGISDENVKALPLMIAKYLQTPKTPGTPN